MEILALAAPFLGSIPRPARSVRFAPSALLSGLMGVSGLASAQDVVTRQITNDAPGAVQCTDPTRLTAGSADVNNMPQGEVMIDVSPQGVLAATAKDYRFGPTESTIYNDRVWGGLYWSADAGDSWRNLSYQNRTPYQGVPTVTNGAYALPSGETITITHQSDPVVAFDREGNLYVNALVFEPGTPEPDLFRMPAGYVVSRHDPSGRLEEGATRFIGLETDATLFGDKNWIAVDRDSPPDETLVVTTWRLFTTEGASAPEGAYLAVSGDGARSFSLPIRVPLLAQDHSRALTFQPMIGPDRVTGRKTLFIVFRVNSPDLFESMMYVLKADVDGIEGTNALAEYLTLPSSWTFLPQRISGVLRFGSDGYDGAFRFRSYFMPAIDPESGMLFAVTHGFDTTHQGSRVLVSSSADAGLTWSSPVAIDNPNRGNQVMPTIAAAGGVVSVLWYDSRHDPSFAPLDVMEGVDVYYAELDASLDLLRVLRLTPTTQVANHPVFTRTRPGESVLRVQAPVQQEGYVLPAPEDAPTHGRTGRSLARAAEPYGFIGDYIGLTVNRQFAYAAWTDLRDLRADVDIRAGGACDGRRNQNVYFARIRKEN